MVVIKPCSSPNASSRTFTIGARQFVVHEAFEMMCWRAGLYVSSLTPTTNVPSASPDGAEMMTFFAPAARWAEAAAFPVKKPVDSMTTSTPSSSHGRSAGSRSDSTERHWPSTVIADFVALTVPG